MIILLFLRILFIVTKEFIIKTVFESKLLNKTYKTFFLLKIKQKKYKKYHYD